MSSLGPFGRLARFVLNHRVLVFIGVVLFTVVGVVGSSFIQVDSNLLALLPEEDRAAQDLRRLHNEEGGVNLVTLAFEGEDPVALETFLDDLVLRIEKVDGVRFAIHEVDPDLAFRIGLLQLSTDEVSELTLRLKGALALGPALNPIVTQRLMDMGPLTQKIARAGQARILGGEEGKGRVVVRPTGSSMDPVFSKKLMDGIEGALADAKPGDHHVRVRWIGGAYRHSVEDREGIWNDVKVTSGASAALVLAIIAIWFRKLRGTLLLYLPLLAASAMNLALTCIFFESINTYTSFGTALLLGLGIDYGTHLIARYREIRHQGHEVEDAICRAWDRTGPPVTTSCITSVAGFAALGVARFQGFSQLGVVLAVGLLLSLLLAIIVTPVLIVWFDANPPAPFGGKVQARPRALATYRLAPMGLMVAVLLTGLAATRLTKLEWEFDISALRRDGLAYAELSQEERTLARESFSPVVVSYPDQATMAADVRRLEKRVENGDLPHVARVVSIENVLPSDQAARVHALGQLAALLDHPNLRYLPPPLVKNLLRLKDFDGRAITRADLPEPVLGLLGAGREDQHRILLFPQGNMWDLREAAMLADEVRTAVPGRPAAGEFVAMGSLYRTVQADMPLVVGLALMLVAALTMIDLRRFHWFAGAFGTLIAGLVWAGVALEAMDVRLSILNMVGLPILLGIGVDVTVHLTHRLREEGPGGVRRALRTTGVAAIVSTVTTVASFISLLLAGNRGIRSLGLLVSVGLTTVFIVSTVVLPLAWSAGWRVTGRAPGAPRRRGHAAQRASSKREAAVSETSEP